MTQVENLWGEITKKGDVTFPKAILDQQAKYLSDMTKKYLVGEVRTTTLISDTFLLPTKGSKKNSLLYEFLVKAPKIGYQFVLLSVQFDLKGYPIILINELENQNIEVANEQEFKKQLSQILQSPSTQQALNTLLSQNS